MQVARLVSESFICINGEGRGKVEFEKKKKFENLTENVPLQLLSSLRFPVGINCDMQMPHKIVIRI